MASNTLRIGLVTTMWQRPELTRLIFQNIARLRDELTPALEIVPAVAGSEGATSSAIAEESGFLYTEVANAPLGAKWNAALALLRDQNVDGVCILGSDDLVDKNYFLALTHHIAQGLPLLAVERFYFFDQASGRMLLWKGYFSPDKKDDSIGAGRFIHHQVIELLRWKLWDDKRPFGLDLNMRQRLKHFAGNQADFYKMPWEQFKYMGVDIKSKTVMTSFEGVASTAFCRLEGEPHSLFSRHFPAHIVEAVFSPEVPRLSGSSLDMPGPWCPTLPVTGFEVLALVAPDDAHYASLAACESFCQAADLPVERVHPEALPAFYQRNANKKIAACVSSEPNWTLLQTADILQMAQKFPFFTESRGRDPEQAAKLVPLGLYQFWDEKSAPPAKADRFVPLPRHTLPIPEATPTFEQRRNFFAGRSDDSNAHELLTAFMQARCHINSYKLFMSAVTEVKTYQNSGLFFLIGVQCRQALPFFRVGLLMGPSEEQYQLLALLNFGVPVVCFKEALGGLALGPEQGVFVAQSPQEAMGLALALHERKVMWCRASLGAHNYVRMHWGPDPFAAALNRLSSGFWPAPSPC